MTLAGVTLAAMTLAGVTLAGVTLEVVTLVVVTLAAATLAVVISNCKKTVIRFWVLVCTYFLHLFFRYTSFLRSPQTIQSFFRSCFP